MARNRCPFHDRYPMDVNPWFFSSAALLCALCGWFLYLASIAKDRVPRRALAMFGSQGAAIVASGLAMVSLRGGAVSEVVGPGVVSGLAVIVALLFFVLYSQRKTPLGGIQVEVGQPLPPFSLRDGEGTMVSTSDWRGDRILLKFFRGSW